jgi:plasmid stabilization system protein ParE
MAFKIVWSEHARDDLQSIVFFIAQDNPHAAESFGFQLISKVDVLVQFPKLRAWSRKKMMKTFVKFFFALIESSTKSWKKNK